MPHALIVASNREPYLHYRDDDGTIAVTPTPGGVSVALDSLMRERGGVWIAHGAGNADRETADADGRLRVPPGEPAYTLRRLWIDEEEFRHYYKGFANEGLWPWCHVAHVRPMFKTEDWAAYQRVNRQFAAAIADERPVEKGRSAPIFLNDYHLALVAGELKALEPRARTALFWHIPWPHPDRFRINPWRREVLTGLLANDLLAFQLERDRRNFLTCCRDEFQARVKLGRVHALGRETQTVSAPIGVDFDRFNNLAAAPDLKASIDRLRNEFLLRTPIIGAGVDRLDYTKGIPDRLQAIERMLERRPDLARDLTFVQVGVASRSEIDSYADIEAEIDAQVAAINLRHRGTRDDEGPIRYRKATLRAKSLVALYRLADFCIVSSLHDGMNLVAKEYVASRRDGDGVLVLSELAGAAQELEEAIIINPYDIDGFADKLAQAIDMPERERRRRMHAMRRTVAGHDVFAWASDILEGLEQGAPKRRRFLSWGRKR